MKADPPPALAVPVPPPRIILPPDPTPSPVAEAPAPPTEPAEPRPTRRPPPRVDPARSANAGKAAEVAETPRPPNGSDGAPAPTEETPPADSAHDVALRQQLDRASQDLQNVDYALLSNDLKAQYDTARRFITLGEQALKERNRIFAATLADKAGAIAASLLRR